MNKSEARFISFYITLPEEERNKCLSDSRHWIITLPLTVCSSIEKFVELLGGRIAQRIDSRKIIARISSNSYYYEYGPIGIYIRYPDGKIPYEFDLVVEEITEDKLQNLLTSIGRNNLPPILGH